MTVDRVAGFYWVFEKGGEQPVVAFFEPGRGWGIWGKYQEIPDNRVTVLSDRLELSPPTAQMPEDEPIGYISKKALQRIRRGQFGNGLYHRKTDVINVPVYLHPAIAQALSAPPAASVGEVEKAVEAEREAIIGIISKGVLADDPYSYGSTVVRALDEDEIIAAIRARSGKATT